MAQNRRRLVIGARGKADQAIDDGTVFDRSAMSVQAKEQLDAYRAERQEMAQQRARTRRR